MHLETDAKVHKNTERKSVRRKNAKSLRRCLFNNNIITDSHN